MPGWISRPSHGLLAAALLAVAAATFLLAAPAPSYDPWTWLLWGREIAGGDLSTEEGPAFKPLPVALATALAPLGDAAPWAWVLLARAGAIAGLVLAFLLARRLAGGSLAAGVLAVGAVLVTGGFAGFAAAGLSEGLLLACALGAAEAWRRGRPRVALALAVACGLLRVETWPFLVVAGVVAWRRRPEDRRLLVAGAVLVPAAWFVPEALGSGDPLRSGSRARVPNPGQPALADVPAWASLRDALGLPPWPVWLGLGAAVALHARAALAPAAAGAAWIAIVALMALAGFSGEARYALPGAALLAVSGAAGLALAARAAGRAIAARVLAARAARLALAARAAWAWARKPTTYVLKTAHGWRGRAVATAPATAATVATVAALAALVVPRAGDLADVRTAQSHQWRLQHDLVDAIAAAGGGEALLACGTPYVGRYRGPLAAYALEVEKRAVEPDALPRPPGVVLRSRLTRDRAPEPVAPKGFAPVAANRTWQVLARCRSRRVRAP